MNVASLCEREVVTVPASATVRQAAAAMRDQHVGALAVTDPGAPDRVIGIVTDRDLVLDLLATGRPVEGQAIGALCRTDLVTVAATAMLDEAIGAMRHAGVRRLLVLDAHGAVAGLVSLDDLLHAVAGELGALAAAARAGVVGEGGRQRALARAQGEAPRPLFIAHNEP